MKKDPRFDPYWQTEFNVLSEKINNLYAPIREVEAHVEYLKGAIGEDAPPDTSTLIAYLIVAIRELQDTTKELNRI